MEVKALSVLPEVNRGRRLFPLPLVLKKGFSHLDDLNLKKRIWWTDLDQDIKGLLRESVLLIEKVKTWEEGFLKNLFLDCGFISEEDYYGKRFRVGKALNPSLDRKLRKKEGVYDQIVAHCQGQETADGLWEVWRSGRNRLFHWFPREKNVINYEQARERVAAILNVMDLAYGKCNMKSEI